MTFYTAVMRSSPVLYTAEAVDSRLGSVRRRLRTVYIPYSDSALTWLLKDCFGLNCCTTLVTSQSLSRLCLFT